MRATKALLAATALLALSTAAQANLVVNGDFEMTTKAENINFEFGQSFPANANAVTGWTSPSTAAYNLYFDVDVATTDSAEGRFEGTNREFLYPSFNAVGASPLGGNFVGLDGDSNFSGPLEQTITDLIVGQAYELSFYWAASQIASRTGPTTEQLVVSFGDDVFSTDVVSVASEATEGWFLETVTFTATSTSQLLSFLSIGTPNGLPPIALLDGVSLEAVETPSPASLAVFGLGLLGLGAARLRRR